MCAGGQTRLVSAKTHLKTDRPLYGLQTAEGKYKIKETLIQAKHTPATGNSFLFYRKGDFSGIYHRTNYYQTST
jgi:hypothetical protein